MSNASEVHTANYQTTPLPRQAESLFTHQLPAAPPPLSHAQSLERCAEIPMAPQSVPQPVQSRANGQLNVYLTTFLQIPGAKNRRRQRQCIICR